MFAGTVRDHADGRPGVVSLEYEAYEKAALREMESIVAKLRHSWPRTGRIALLHRTGLLVPSDVCVIVAVSAPHRAEAFEAARYGIDATKELVPIWKRESWQGGSSWGLDSTPARGAGDLNAEDHLSRAGN
jgi:molybdopterin synthase catalytic subunit